MSDLTSAAVLDEIQCLGCGAACAADGLRLDLKVPEYEPILLAEGLHCRTCLDARVNPPDPLMQLADQARAHVLGGGCSGDLCRECNGQGECKTVGTFTARAWVKCWACDGRGLR